MLDTRRVILYQNILESTSILYPEEILIHPSILCTRNQNSLQFSPLAAAKDSPLAGLLGLKHRWIVMRYSGDIHLHIRIYIYIYIQVYTYVIYTYTYHIHMYIYIYIGYLSLFPFCLTVLQVTNNTHPTERTRCISFEIYRVLTMSP